MTGPIAHIIARTAEAFDVPVEEILSDRRQKPVVVARQVAMTLARQLTPASYPAIARAFRRDHTTVMHAEERTAWRMVMDPNIDLLVAELADRLRQELPSIQGETHR